MILKAKLKNILPGIVIAAFSFVHADAKVTLPSVFTDNMVLQQKSDVAIWGKSSPGKAITINETWSNKQYHTTASENGDWTLKIKTPAYGGPYSISISDGEIFKLNNILIGDVWICSGQSNMEMPLAGWGRITDYQKEISAADYPGIRLFQAEHVASVIPLQEATTKTGWQPCTPASVAEFSSVAYFFAREIYKKTGVPIGLIHTSWGGTIAEAWTSGSALKTMPDFAEAVKKIENQNKTGQKIPYAQKLQSWSDSLLLKDAGYKNGIPAWASGDPDASSWKTMVLPALWEDSVLPAFDGVVWFRKTVAIPPAMTGKDLRLNLGMIDDDDITFFNGEKIGRTKGYNVSRTYIVPGKLVKQGNNTITVRVFDGTGGGGIYGESDSLFLKPATGDGISLSGEWKYQVGLNLKNYTPMPVSEDGPNRPAVLYNAMIYPFIRFSIKGAIWYQGEANADRAYQYRELFPLLIKDWRNKWGIGDFPFYFVQLANYMAKDKNPVASDWAELREAQLKTLALPNTGMAVTIDIGDAKDIHPKNKQDVGRRLALIALNKCYDKPGEYSGPIFKSYKKEKDRIIVTFDHAEGLQTKTQGKLTGFAVAGNDKKFYWANAVIKDGKVELKSTDVSDPVAVRYGWGNNPDCNLYNGSGLPASPFRTDDWKDAAK